MNKLDLSVLQTIRTWLQENSKVILVSVAETWGSSPRPVGSMMAWRDSGQFVGSVSGGCIEEELLAEFEQRVPTKAMIRDYGVSAEQAAARGLPCGGRLKIVVEPLAADEDFTAIIDAVEGRGRIERVVDLHSGKSSSSPAASDARSRFDGEKLSVVFEANWRLLVIGAGELSQYVHDFASQLGYQVLVCDPRENYRESWHAPLTPVASIMPDDFVLESKCDPQTAIVALTHDPKIDDLAVMEALNSTAFYVGALGSKRTNGARRERLKEHFDITDEQLARLSGPIGVDLNTRTAAEIALAVVAEITARRNGVELSSQRISTS